MRLRLRLRLIARLVRLAACRRLRSRLLLIGPRRRHSAPRTDTRDTRTRTANDTNTSRAARRRARRRSASGAVHSLARSRSSHIRVGLTATESSHARRQIGAECPLECDEGVTQTQRRQRHRAGL